MSEMFIFGGLIMMPIIIVSDALKPQNKQADVLKFCLESKPKQNWKDS